MSSDSSKIFLSYSFNDKPLVERVKDVLLQNQIVSIIDYDQYVLGSNFFDELRYNIQRSEYVIVFISNNFNNSKYSSFELMKSLEELRLRNVKVIPVLLERCQIPSDLMEFEIVDLSKSFDAGMSKLISRISRTRSIDLQSLDPVRYERLVHSFLEEYGFRTISNNKNSDIGADFICEMTSKDPFGFRRIETWLVEVKFYSNERFSVNALHKLYQFKRSILPADAKMLLITNSILTSISREYINDLQKQENTAITIIDGPEFEKLVMKRKRLVKKFYELTNE